MNSKEIGYLIKKKRSEVSLKQYELAEKLDISRTYLSDLENGRYLPSAKLLFKINKELQLFIFAKE
ncbi:helix-turn-helix transcriptional regulator [Lysinibacillus sp. K60]|uniref:helix-turn-helix transcriptional regulator n=1 Tax=Lysinibacillus sp. K60 TaxID=2720027 RepID=UPI001C8C2FD4|nr:helix-turn-helix transcriptional regulator [Lysinibacillus sp. K60]MBX8943047.1 helix-turn-helix transcriptional regulator [Lysinibacillus sp. K60]